MAKLRVEFHDPMYGVREIPQHTLKQDMKEAGVTNIGDAIRRLRASNEAAKSWGAGLTWHLDYTDEEASTSD